MDPLRVCPKDKSVPREELDPGISVGCNEHGGPIASSLLILVLIGGETFSGCKLILYQTKPSSKALISKGFSDMITYI